MPSNRRYIFGRKFCVRGRRRDERVILKRSCTPWLNITNVNTKNPYHLHFHGICFAATASMTVDPPWKELRQERRTDFSRKGAMRKGISNSDYIIRINIYNPFEYIRTGDAYVQRRYKLDVGIYFQLLVMLKRTSPKTNQYATFFPFALHCNIYLLNSNA